MGSEWKGLWMARVGLCSSLALTRNVGSGSVTVGSGRFRLLSRDKRQHISIIIIIFFLHEMALYMTVKKAFEIH